MKRINIDRARTQLSRLVDAASKGGTFDSAKSGGPIAKLGPIDQPNRKFKFGLVKGRIWIADDFDAPLPDDLLDAFEGREPE